MAKKVKGFMSEDNIFFESKADADYHDARQVLEGLAIGDGFTIGRMGYIDWIEENQEYVERFIKAAQVKKGHDTEVRDAEEYNDFESRREGVTGTPARQPKDGYDQTDNSPGEEDITRLLKQPARVTEHMPDMGSRVSTKEIRDERKKHGTRSRKRNARRIRSGKDLATGTSTEPTKAR